MIPVTLIFVSVFILAQIPLTVLVGLHRLKTNIQFLDGGDTTMMWRMRAHANFTETVPITLLAMAATETMGAPSELLWAAGVSLAAGRLIHAVTILRYGWGSGRAIGMTLTFLAMAAFGVWGIAHAMAVI